MVTIERSTHILLDAEKVFLLSCSIDLHKISTQHTGEEAIAGVTTGLVKAGDTITWRARHLMKTRYHTSRIEAFAPHTHFRDVMIKGEFKHFSHDHYFEPQGKGCLMKDELKVEAPYGWLGKLFMHLYLKKYLTRFLDKRNATIKDFAESDKWKLILPHGSF